MNLRFGGRGKRFRQTEAVLTTLRSELHQRGFDRVIFTGDATALGFEEESARAATLLGLDAEILPGLAVPGNHDYCTVYAATTGHFERHFAPWLTGERVDNALYPFAQRVGPAWLIAVNSATPNWWPSDASGRVGEDQLCRLETLLQRLEGGPRVLVTHYPVRVSSGDPETPSHALRDLDDLLAVSRAGGVSLWLHGHRHNSYYHPATDDVPFPVLCAGSATQHRLWSYGDYTLAGDRLQVVIRAYDEVRGGFVDDRAFEVRLRTGVPCLATSPNQS